MRHSDEKQTFVNYIGIKVVAASCLPKQDCDTCFHKLDELSFTFVKELNMAITNSPVNHVQLFVKSLILREL